MNYLEKSPIRDFFFLPALNEEKHIFKTAFPSTLAEKTKDTKLNLMTCHKWARQTILIGAIAGAIVGIYESLAPYRYGLHAPDLIVRDIFAGTVLGALASLIPTITLIQVKHFQRMQKDINSYAKEYPVIR